MLALRWRTAMLEAGLSAATINRRLCALRSLVKLARRLGRVTWTLDVEAVKAERRRDMSGPTRGEVLVALESASVRDVAMIRLMADRGLRRGEVCGLDVSDVSEDRRTLSLRETKGKREPVSVELAPETTAVLVAWLTVRGEEPGSLFGVTADTLWRVCGRVVGCRPHGLRHCAATTARDRGATLEEVATFLRHVKLETTRGYFDRSDEVAARVAAVVARP